MATKQNIYVGLNKEAEKILNDINNSIVIYSLHEDGFREILGYHITSANKIRDRVSNLQGKMQLALKGLDKNSLKRDKYEKVLKQCNHFLEVTNR